MPNTVSMTRNELIAHLAAVANRIQSKEGEVSIQRIANFITECANEFDLSNDEQLLFLKFVGIGSTDYKELLKGVGSDS